MLFVINLQFSDARHVKKQRIVAKSIKKRIGKYTKMDANHGRYVLTGINSITF